MFANEKELVEKLVIDLQKKYNTQYIVTEFRSGNNIADVVYTLDINRENIVFDEYFNAYYYFREIYGCRKANIKEFDMLDKQFVRKFHVFLRDLEVLGYVKIDGNYITSVKKIDEVTKNFIAVEAKLSDWKGGLNQAIRYKQYANEVYIAISSENEKKVDKELLRKLNIGLMSISESQFKIPLKAKREKVEKLDIQYYIVDQFLKKLKMSELS